MLRVKNIWMSLTLSFHFSGQRDVDTWRRRVSVTTSGDYAHPSGLGHNGSGKNSHRVIFGL